MQKTSAMGLTHALEAPHPFIFLSIIYLATVIYIYIYVFSI